MKPEAQREAIYRAQGFVQGAELGYNSGQAVLWYRPDPNGTYHNIPAWTKKFTHVTEDPLTDLNAMHEAEKILTPEQQAQYAMTLHEMHGTPLATFWHRVICSTAAQRAEAFLRTLGLWRDA